MLREECVEVRRSILGAKENLNLPIKELALTIKASITVHDRDIIPGIKGGTMKRKLVSRHSTVSLSQQNLSPEAQVQDWIVHSNDSYDLTFVLCFFLRACN